jgi:hypothetical protein
MKKLLLSISIALSGVISANAQFIVGGSVSFNTSAISYSETGKDTEKASSFSITPSIGYRLNDKWEIGLSATVNNSDSKQPLLLFDNDGNLAGIVVWETDTKEYLINPYVRYLIVKFNKFGVHGLFNIFAGKGKTEGSFLSTANTEYTVWGANIRPVLMFDLSNRFTIVSNLDFFNLGFSQNKMKEKYTTTAFDFIVNTKDILPSIGFIYRF